MKAVRIHEDGGPDVLRYEDAPDPAPQEGEVLVHLRAAALNHLDLWVRQGLPSVPKPRILGADGAGTLDNGERVVINPASTMATGGSPSWASTWTARTPSSLRSPRRTSIRSRTT